MEREEKQFKIIDYNDPKKLNSFKDANDKKNKELEEKKQSKPKKINISNFITKRKIPPKTDQAVFFDKKIEEFFEKKEEVLAVVRELPIAENTTPVSPQVQPQPVIIHSEVVEHANSESSEWQTVTDEENKEEHTAPNDSQGYVLQTSGFLVDIETNRVILGDPATADFNNLNDKFDDMNLSVKKYDLDSVKLNDSDLETPYTISRKRKFHEISGEADHTPQDVESIYKHKRNVPFDVKDNELVSFSKEKRSKFVKKNESSQTDFPPTKKD